MKHLLQNYKLHPGEQKNKNGSNRKRNPVKEVNKIPLKIPVKIEIKIESLSETRTSQHNQNLKKKNQRQLFGN